MRIHLITIGNELLEGQIVNTNSSFLCNALYQNGYLAERQTSILDDPKEIFKTFEESLQEFDVTLCSGGLGPTLDDCTLNVACKLFKTSLVYSEKLEEKIKKLITHVKIPNLSKACYIPKKGKIFSKHIGMAPGYLFEKGKKKLILLPGVPYEFKHLVEKEVLPLLKKDYPLENQEYKKILHLCKVPESGIAPYIEELHQAHPKLSFGLYPHFGILSIHIKCNARTKKEALTQIHPVFKELKKKYTARSFDGKYASIEEALHHFFIERGLKLSFAESCTGGSLVANFTQIPNASQYLQGSIVAYQNEIKTTALGVSPQVIEAHGSVSAECANEMALGANKLFNSDIAISTTGIAGPTGGTLKKPVGTVYVAIAHQNKIIFNAKLQLKGTRSIIIQRTLFNVLAEFWMMRDNFNI